MKNLTFAVVFLAIITHLSAADITLPIKRATIYEEGATITRIGQVQLKKGDQTIRITDLPVHLDYRSLDIWLSGDATILSQKFEYSYKGQEVNLSDIERDKDILLDSLSYYEMLMSIKGEEKIS